jgi:hypothetical protein
MAEGSIIVKKKPLRRVLSAETGFGLQLIDYFSLFLFSERDELLNAEKVAPLGKRRKYFERLPAYFEKNKFTGECDVVNLYKVPCQAYQKTELVTLLKPKRNR